MNDRVRTAIAGVLFVTLGLMSSLPALAWTNDPSVNLAVCNAASNQRRPVLAPDGAGGAIMAWEDSRAAGPQIYVQRVSATGAALWTANGVAITSGANGKTLPAIVSDGAGGAIVTWKVSGITPAQIWAQRVNSAGVVQWTAGGVTLGTSANLTQQTPLAIVTDGAGGAIVAWEDVRSGLDVYAQRVDASGSTAWTLNGVAVGAAVGSQRAPVMIADGAGGAILAWQDLRNLSTNDIFAQRVNAAGAVQWTANGIAVCAASSDQVTPAIAGDNAGGAIVVWADVRSESDADTYAQRVNSSGAAQWTPDGVAVSAVSSSDETNPVIAPDDAGGAVVAWLDARDGYGDLYAQRVNASGTTQWTTNGVVLSATNTFIASPRLIPDGSGGAIVTWSDDRNGPNDIFARQVTGAGAPAWLANGVPVSTATNLQQFADVTSDGSGGALLCWQDARNGADDIYAQRVLAGGTLAGASVPGTSSGGLAAIVLVMAGAASLVLYRRRLRGERA